MNFNPFTFWRDKSGDIEYPFLPTADHYHVNYVDNNQEQEYNRKSFAYLPPHAKKAQIQTHCANCGAPLNPTKARCEYCNSYYKEEDNYVLESL